jgi:predicted transcriptional regulator
MPFDNIRAEASPMSAPCEVAVKRIIPLVRAMVAKELVVKHRLRQTEVAGKPRISQPAMSLYRSKLRGKAIDLENDEDIRNQVSSVTKALA